MTMTADAALSGVRSAPPALAAESPTPPAAVLLASRSAATRLRLSRLFEEAGLVVLEANDLDGARQVMRRAPRLDLIVLECPSLVGDELAFCQTVASGPRIPLLVLAAAADLVDEIVALELGADDLLTGEVADRLVLARARALLRRSRRDDAPARPRRPEPAGWRLDPLTRRAISPAGRSVVLTPGHASVLHLFLTRPGAVFTCEDGARALGSEAGGAAAFRTTVCRLRQKLETLNDGQPIQTVRGIGYTYLPKERRVRS